jgi:hypothetical protein
MNKFIIKPNQSEANIGVVHLIWRPCGIETFNAFLQSYIKNLDKQKHELILVFNGFSSEKEISEYKLLLANLNYSFVFIKDKGFDIGSYFIATNIFNYEYYCFLNSYSIILDKEWLSKMYYYISQEHVGLVGATASYESLYSALINNIRNGTFLNTPIYRRIIRDSCFNILRHLYYYSPFPNYHIRTNAFMIKKEVLSKIKYKNIRSKLDTLRFENGRNGLTTQILKMKLDALVVGKDGKAYKKEDWSRSNTFRQNNQENLLISDNQTEDYLKANSEKRMYLSKLAWGDYQEIL